MQVLPTCYGGSAEMVRIEDAAMLAHQKSQAVARQAQAAAANEGQGRFAAFKRSMFYKMRLDAVQEQIEG